MLSTEQGVIPGSDFYIHTPSAQASAMYLSCRAGPDCPAGLL